MKMNYEVVPTDLITGKDLDYISDMFQWNYEALKKVNNFMEIVQDEELVQSFEDAYQLFDDNLNSILDILNNSAGGEE